jgi:hypothetical protein
MVDPRRQVGPAGATWLLTALLVLAATADLARCGIGFAFTGDRTRTVLLFTSGAVAAGMSLITAAGAIRRRRWAFWSAALIGLASAPQAATSGFRSPYAIPDVATAVLGLLLTVTVLVGSQGAVTDSAPTGVLPCPFEPGSDGRR